MFWRLAWWTNWFLAAAQETACQKLFIHSIVPGKHTPQGYLFHAERDSHIRLIVFPRTSHCHTVVHACMCSKTMEQSCTWPLRAAAQIYVMLLEHTEWLRIGFLSDLHWIATFAFGTSESYIEQMADTIDKGSLTQVQWQSLLQVIHVCHPPSRNDPRRHHPAATLSSCLMCLSILDLLLEQLLP